MQTYVRRRSNAARGQKGAVAVEFALILPLLALLLLGTVTAGLAYSRAIGLTNAVREGARFGATADITSATWANDVLARTRESQFDDAANSAASSTTVCVRLVGASTPIQQCSNAGVNPPPTPAFPGSTPTLAPDECVVQVWASRRYQIILGIAPSIDSVFNKPSTARYERAC